MVVANMAAVNTFKAFVGARHFSYYLKPLITEGCDVEDVRLPIKRSPARFLDQLRLLMREKQLEFRGQITYLKDR